MKKTFKLILLLCLLSLVCALALTSCGDVGAQNHSHTVVIDPAVPATCTEAGLTQGKHCSTCGEILVKQEKLNALGHTEVEDEAVAPTCTEDGHTKGKHCSVCGEVTVAGKIQSAFGHVVSVSKAVTPTCDKVGLTEGKYCSVCSEVLVSQIEIPAKGHSFGDWVVTKEPTATEAGEKRRECSDCGEYETDIIASTVHDHSAFDTITLAAVAPTCTTTGLTEGKKCSGCGEIIVAQDTVPAKGHNRETKPAVEATCTSSGLTRGEYCTTCGATFVTQTVIPALGHNYSYSEVPGEEGTYANICTRCGHMIKAVTYEEYGAKGDGVTDDSEAIRAAHDYANENGLPVEGKAGATYYIGSISQTIVIKTDTNWNGATFILDDHRIRWDNTTLRNIQVFTVAPDTAIKTVSVPSSLAKNGLSKGQTNIGMTFSEPCMIKIENSNEKIYVRVGVNANSGANKNELILVDENGNVDPSTPIQYDYSSITKITVYSIDEKAISVGNATFTTIAPNPKEYDPDFENAIIFFNRGLYVERSNTTVHDITHIVENEMMTIETDRNGDGVIDKWGADKSYGVSYNGFFNFGNSYNVTMQDCIVEGHQAYSFWVDLNGVSTRNEVGNYDITASNCVNLNMIRVIQYENAETGEVITNRFMYHGIMGTNWCRNMVLDGCYLDRFDAHQGLYNATLKNSTFGFGILVIGGGKLYIENVTRVSGAAFVHLRMDYNSVFNGDVEIVNSEMTSELSTIVEGQWIPFYNGLPNHMTNSLIINGLTTPRTSICLYNILDATSASLTDATNPLLLPTYIKIDGLKRPNGGEVGVTLSSTSGLFTNVDFEMHEHTWDSGTVITPASTTNCKAGVIRYTCTDSSCGATTDGVILSTQPHSSLTHTITDGAITYTCPTCNASYVPDVNCAADGSDYSVLQGGGANSSRGYTTGSSDNPLIEDGVYKLLKTNSDDSTQLELWLPSKSNGLNELSSENNAVGYLSFKINAFSESGLSMKFVDINSNVNENRWKEGGVIVDNFFTVSAPYTSWFKTKVDVTGWDGLTLKTVEVGDDNFTGWIDVKMVIELSASEDTVTVHYYIDGSYVGTKSRTLTTLGNCISGIYVSGYTQSEGSGLMLDDVAFGCSFGKRS